MCSWPINNQLIIWSDGYNLVIVKRTRLLLFKASFRFLTAGPALDHLVDQAELHRLDRRQKLIALERGLDRLERLVGGLNVNLVEPRPQSQDLARLDLDIGSLPLRPARGLMDHDPGVRQ